MSIHSWRCAALTAAAGLALATSCAAAAAPPAGAIDCFGDLMHGKGPVIACEFPVEPNAVERLELARATRGYVKNVHCLVSIKIERALVLAAVDNPDHVFEAPPQPVACEIEAILKEGRTTTCPVAGMFSPRVVIKDGRAVEATPGLGEITGVTRALSWPVETWVNRGAMVREGMLQAVNAWLAPMQAMRGPRRSAQR